MHRISVAVFAALLTLATASAQAQTWVQIAARPTEAQALERAEDFARRLPDVNGFALPSGWFAIALGPYADDVAAAELFRLRTTGAIPGDSFLSDGRTFGRRFFGSDDPAPAAAAPAPAPAAPAVLVPADETPAQSRAAEQALTREERAEVQEALQWEGFYASAIDASFGPGTRRAMEAWQAANGYQPTGVLSTAQRAALLDSYRQDVASIGLTTVTESRAGIEIALPTAMVAFDRYEAPFVQYRASDDSGVRVLLISQSGDRDTLASLYDVMQTLEIVPLSGPRSLDRDAFRIEGSNSEIWSSTYAELTRDGIKGFTLVWPVGDERRRDRVAQAMRASFTPTAGVLPDDAGQDGARQQIDLLAGLQIRRPDLTRSGFFVDGSGRVLTSADAVASCARVSIGDETDARVVASDAALGVALLQPTTALAPIDYARFSLDEPRLAAEIAVAGFTYGGILSAPTLTFGSVADVRGLDGDERLARLTLETEDGDAGGPVFDAQGAVVGLLKARGSDGSRQLPADVRFSPDAAALAEFLSRNGVAPSVDASSEAMAPEDLTTRAADLTVLVACWN